MQAYLAEKYMSGKKADAILAKMAPEKKKKKKKRRETNRSLVKEVLVRKKNRKQLSHSPATCLLYCFFSFLRTRFVYGASKQKR